MPRAKGYKEPPGFSEDGIRQRRRKLRVSDSETFKSKGTEVGEGLPTDEVIFLRELIAWQGDVLDSRTIEQFIGDTPGADRSRIRKALLGSKVRKEIDARLEESIQSSRPMVLKSMMWKIQRGDAKESSRYLEVTGLHVPRKKIERENRFDPSLMSDEELDQEIQRRMGDLDNLDEGSLWKQNIPQA